MASRPETLGAPEAVDEIDESLFRAHFKRLPGPAFMWQRNGADFRLIAHNDAATRIESNRVTTLVGISARVLYADRPDVFEELRRCAEDALVVTKETDFMLLSGRTLRFVLTHIPLGDDIVVCHVEDVTERRAAERILRETEARTRALFHSNPDITLRMDAQCNYLDLYVAETTPFPFTRDQVLGRHVSDFFSPEVVAEHERCVNAALLGGEVQISEFAHKIGAHEIHLEARFVRSGPAEVVVSVRDVSERVNLERGLIEAAEHERNRLGQDLHDGLAQMLTGVKLLLSSLKTKLTRHDAKLAEAAGQAVALIDTSIGQARGLARGLSPVAKGETLANSLHRLARQSTDILPVEVSADCAGQTAQVDEKVSIQVYRVAQEAITNAVRHGKATKIDVSCMTAGETLVMQIRDNGTGMAETLPRGEGEGLGLRIMRHRMKSIGGTLSIASSPDGGTLVSCSCRAKAASTNN